MAYTTGPSIGITLLVFLCVGFGGNAATAGLNWPRVCRSGLRRIPHPSLACLWRPVAVHRHDRTRVPAAPALFVGVLLGAFTAVVFQPEVVQRTVAKAIGDLQRPPTSPPCKPWPWTCRSTRDTIWPTSSSSSSGMNGMLNTVWLIVCAMTFGAVLQATGMLARLTEALVAG